MNKRLCGTLSGAMLLALVALPVHAAAIELFDWGVNIDGTSSMPTLGDPIPAEVDVSQFDQVLGLGIINMILDGVGNHFVGLFVDHDIDEAINTYFNESGSAAGAPVAGQSWEIDEPGFVFGDIFDNFLAGTFDSTNAVPAGLEDDVSMGLGWDFVLATDEIATIVFNLSETAPVAGFYLQHTDPDSVASIYFSSSITTTGGADPIPAPAPLLLLGAGLLGMGAIRRRKAEEQA